MSRMRMVVGLLVALVFVVCIPPGSVRSDVGDDPPIVIIRDLDWVAIDSLFVKDDEPFTLVADVAGTQPFQYLWSLNDEVIPDAIGIVLRDYVITIPGLHLLVLTARDVNDLSSSDTCFVTVEESPVSTQAVSWGALKGLY